VRECDAERPADPDSRDEFGCLLEDVHEAVCHTQLMLGRALRARENGASTTGNPAPIEMRSAIPLFRLRRRWARSSDLP